MERRFLRSSRREMKRQNHLFEQIITFENIRKAYIKALRGKRNSTAVLVFSKNVDVNLENIRSRLTRLEPDWGHYHQFTIYDPKVRVISAAPFCERVMHHSLMNVLEPIFERHLAFHSYACRKGKGTQTAILYAFSCSKANNWFLKLDIRKFFDSISHQILKNQLRRLFKDQRLLFLLDGLIDSYHTSPATGLPIGNLTSQFFANQYLSSMDHYILEKLCPKAYVRYMDDFVLWADSKETLAEHFTTLKSWIYDSLSLSLKPEILGKTTSGLPFLGCLIKPHGIYLLQKTKKRMKKKAYHLDYQFKNGTVNEYEAGSSALSINASALLAHSYNFRVHIWNGSGFGL